jgi:hypothetical protein
LKNLINHFREIRDGLGLHKNPGEYGAFTTDPYSHTPSIAGVQQPGMTGQVKEDILSRWIELGISVEKGEIRINPVILKGDDFINSGKHQNTDLPHEPVLEFTFCGVPFTYVIKDPEGIFIEYSNGESRVMKGLNIDPSSSREISERTGKISKVRVNLSSKKLVL